MYDYSGLVDRLIRPGVMLAVVLIVGWMGRRKGKKLFIAAFLAAVLPLVTIVHYGLALHQPQIEMLQGAYAGSSRSTIASRGMRSYAFDTGTFDLETCRLGHLAARRILPDEMQEGAEYRVWYEARTDIIVKCERTSP